jgi:hypothetical protein
MTTTIGRTLRRLANASLASTISESFKLAATSRADEKRLYGIDMFSKMKPDCKKQKIARNPVIVRT